MIKVIVDNWWYKFSPSSHYYYTSSDVVKLHGKDQFVSYVKDYYKGKGSVSFQVDNIDYLTSEELTING